jgi:hypothetical protein
VLVSEWLIDNKHPDSRIGRMKIVTLFGFIFLAAFLRAQNKNEVLKGYIINQGDTIKGVFKVREPFDLYLSCEFQANGSSQFRVYEPTTLNFFFVETLGKFASKKIKDTANPEVLINRFLLVMEEGRAWLYFIRNDGAQFRLFIEKENTIYELENNLISFQDRDGGNYLRKSYRFRGILNFIFKDCKQSTDHLSFTPSAIQTAVFKYNQCHDPSHKLLSEGVATERIKQSIGFRLNTYHTSLKTDYLTPTTELVNSESIGAGTFYQLQFSKVYRFQGGLDLYHTHGSYQINYNNGSYQIIQTDLTQAIISLELMACVRSNYNLQFFFTGGFNFIIPIKEKIDFGYLTVNTFSIPKGLSFGFGAIQKLPKNRELLIKSRYMINSMSFNSYGYHVNYNVFELSLGVSGLFGNGKMKSKKATVY